MKPWMLRLLLSKATGGDGFGTNFLLSPNDYESGSWSKAGAVVTPNAALGPTGLMNATKLEISGSSFGLYQGVVRSVAQGVIQRVSARMRADAPTDFLIGFNGMSSSQNNQGVSCAVTTEWQLFQFDLNPPVADSGLFVLFGTLVAGGGGLIIESPRTVYIALGAHYGEP